jgi:hypothetical protein
MSDVVVVGSIFGLLLPAGAAAHLGDPALAP